jgi:hypothetical protein
MEVKMKLEDYETRMVHDGKRNNREVKIECERCGKENWVRWQRVRQGKGRFCSLECFNEFQREEGTRKWGVDNARFHWDKSNNRWQAYWHDEASGKPKSTTKARWLWKKWIDTIPDRSLVVTYKDGNPENCELDNLELMPRSAWNEIHLIGHEVSDETKQKLSDAHSGKTLSDEHKRKISRSLYARWESGEFEDIHVGENNYKWRGGVEGAYPKEFNIKLKRQIKERDKDKCRICGQIQERMEVHHIDGNRNDNSLDNLILFCVSCHHRVHDGAKESDPVILAFRSALDI